MLITINIILHTLTFSKKVTMILLAFPKTTIRINLNNNYFLKIGNMFESKTQECLLKKVYLFSIFLKEYYCILRDNKVAIPWFHQYSL